MFVLKTGLHSWGVNVLPVYFVLDNNTPTIHHKLDWPALQPSPSSFHQGGSRGSPPPCRCFTSTQRRPSSAGTRSPADPRNLGETVLIFLTKINLEKARDEEERPLYWTCPNPTPSLGLHVSFMTNGLTGVGARGQRDCSFSWPLLRAIPNQLSRVLFNNVRIWGA